MLDMEQIKETNEVLDEKVDQIGSMVESGIITKEAMEAYLAKQNMEAARDSTETEDSVASEAINEKKNIETKKSVDNSELNIDRSKEVGWAAKVLEDSLDEIGDIVGVATLAKGLQIPKNTRNTAGFINMFESYSDIVSALSFDKTSNEDKDTIVNNLRNVKNFAMDKAEKLFVTKTDADDFVAVQYNYLGRVADDLMDENFPDNATVEEEVSDESVIAKYEEIWTEWNEESAVNEALPKQKVGVIERITKIVDKVKDVGVLKTMQDAIAARIAKLQANNAHVKEEVPAEKMSTVVSVPTDRGAPIHSTPERTDPAWSSDKLVKIGAVLDAENEEINAKEDIELWSVVKYSTAKGHKQWILSNVVLNSENNWTAQVKVGNTLVGRPLDDVTFVSPAAVDFEAKATKLDAGEIGFGSKVTYTTAAGKASTGIVEWFRKNIKDKYNDGETWVAQVRVGGMLVAKDVKDIKLVSPVIEEKMTVDKNETVENSFSTLKVWQDFVYKNAKWNVMKVKILDSGKNEIDNKTQCKIQEYKDGQLAGAKRRMYDDSLIAWNNLVTTEDIKQLETLSSDEIIEQSVVVQKKEEEEVVGYRDAETSSAWLESGSAPGPSTNPEAAIEQQWEFVANS